MTESSQLNFGWALLLSFLAFTAGPEFSEFQRWTDPLDWFVNCHWSLMVGGLLWGIVFLPWAVLVKVIYRCEHWRRFRTFWIVFPALAMFAYITWRTVASPPTAEGRFEALTHGVALPSDATNLRYHFWGGTWTSHKDTYYFHSSPAQVDRLISDLHLENGDREEDSKRPTITDIKVLPQAPDPKSWEGALQFTHGDGWRFILLVANATKTEVYIHTERIELP